MTVASRDVMRASGIFATETSAEAPAHLKPSLGTMPLQG